MIYSLPAPLQEGGAGKHMIVEWRKPLEVEVDEGLSVCASDLDQQEDHPNKEQCLLKEREIRDPLTEAKFLLV